MRALGGLLVADEETGQNQEGGADARSDIVTWNLFERHHGWSLVGEDDVQAKTVAEISEEQPE